MVNLETLLEKYVQICAEDHGVAYIRCVIDLPNFTPQEQDTLRLISFKVADRLSQIPRGKYEL